MVSHLVVSWSVDSCLGHQSSGYIHHLDLRHGSAGRWARSEIGARLSANNGADQASHVASPEEPEECTGCLSLAATVLRSQRNLVGKEEILIPLAFMPEVK